MAANLSFGKKSSRVPLTEGCCRLPLPRVRPCAGTALFLCSSRQTWIFASSLYSAAQLLICSRPFQSKNSNVKGGVEGREVLVGGSGWWWWWGPSKSRGKKNAGPQGKCQRDKYLSSLRPIKVGSSQQDVRVQAQSSKGEWSTSLISFSVFMCITQV